MWQNIIAACLSLVAFLGGLAVMRQGMEGMAEGRLTLLLQKLVSSPTRGILTGAVSTGVLQSSAAITAITVGLVAGGSLTFRNALGIILGSNVGSTVTPQLLTLNLWSFVIPSLLLGVLGFLSRNPKFRYPSMALIGFASIFISLQALQLALHPLRTTPWFVHTLASAGKNPLWAVTAGCFASAIIQSSTATTIITMTLSADGIIQLPAAIAIILGANIGTCLTSVIAALGQSREAQQVALSHVLLNVGGVVVTLPFLNPFAELMKWLTPDPRQQIANAHTLFNIVCTLIVWPITTSFAELVERLLPNQRHT